MDETLKNLTKGTLIALAGILVGIAISIVIKMLTTNVNLVTILFYRFLFSLPLLIGFSLFACGAQFYLINDKLVMFLRVVFGISGLVFWILAIKTLSLGLATALFHSSVLFVTFLAPIFLNERTTIIRFLASLTGLFGVFLLTNPLGENFSINVIFGVCSAICGACLSVSLRKLGKTDHPATVALIYNLFGAITIGLVIVAKPTLLVRPSVEEFSLLVILGILVSITQILLTNAYYFLDAVVVSCLGYLRVPFAALTAFILFSETLSKVEIFGATVIVASSCLILFQSSKQKNI